MLKKLAAMKFNYRHTLATCCLGNVSLTIVNFLPPLLFVVFMEQFNLNITLIGYLMVANFGVQSLTDLLAAKYLDKIGYRRGAVFSAAFCALGLLSLSILPFLFSQNPYLGLLIATIISGIGGGLTEVLLSPIVEAIPNSNTAANMSILHAFFGWGYAAVALFSTLFFIAFGTTCWYVLPVLWALIPLSIAYLYLRVPISSMGKNRQVVKLLPLLRSRIVLLLLLTMIAVGAAELAIAQWVSYFAEIGLQVSKTTGDLIGACGFAFLLAIGRMIYAKIASRKILIPALLFSGILCAISYLLIVFAPSPLLSLLGCALCGLAVAAMWPAMFSLTALVYPQGGTAMFALLALAGDIGCTVGPGVVGLISGQLQNAASPLKIGIFCAGIFPLITIWGVLQIKKHMKQRRLAH